METNDLVKTTEDGSTATGCRLCTIIPNYLLQHLANNQAAPERVRACAARTVHHNTRLHGARLSQSLQHSEAHQDAFHGIVPSYMHQAVLDSANSTEEQKDRARKNLAKSARIRAAREGLVAPIAAAEARPKRLFRVIYDSGLSRSHANSSSGLIRHRAYG